MSILNVSITDKLALVGVDTEAVLELEGSTIRAEMSKMIPLVHIGGMLTGRGNALFLLHAFNACHNAAKNLDDLLDGLPELLQEISKYFAQFAVLPKTMGRGGKQEIVLVGYSSAKNKIVGRVFCGDMIEGVFEARDIQGAYAAPWPTDWSNSNPETPQPVNIPDMVRLAKSQVALLHERAPGESGGGKFIVARISRDEMLIRQECDLDAE